MPTLDELKQEIWVKCKKSLVLVQAAADKANVTLPITTVAQAEAVIKALTPKKKKPKPVLSEAHIKRYRDAKYQYELENYVHWITDGHFLEPEIPNTATSNGLTEFIIKYLNWKGHRATRISVEGRVLHDGKRIPSSTRKGTADISCTINGRACMLEVKVGKDRPSPTQIKEQDRERKAGGVYEFIHNVGEFFAWYDRFCIFA